MQSILHLCHNNLLDLINTFFIWFYFYHLFSRCKHTTWETTIAKLNIKKSEDLKEKAFDFKSNKSCK